MTKVFTVMQTKGGVGKTTTAIYLATALARTHSVEVWDADPQGSATDWAEEAKEVKKQLPFEVKPVNRAMLRRAAEKADTDIVIIDTPPGNAGLLDEAISASSVVILPASPGLLDVRRLIVTAQTLPEDVLRVALVTRAKRDTAALRETLDFLADNDEIPAFSKPIYHRESIQNSVGEKPRQLFEYEDAAKELMEALT